MERLYTFLGVNPNKLPQTVLEREGAKNNDSRQRQHGRAGQLTFLTALLYVIAHVTLGVQSRSYLRKSQLHVFFVWLQSCFALLFLWVFERRRRSSFILQIRHVKALPMLCCYVVYIALNESYSNGYKNSSGGPEVLQLGLATCPLFAVLVNVWLNEKRDVSFVTAIVVFASLLITVIFCGENDPYIPYKFSASYGIFGLLHGLSLALFVLLASYYIHVEEMPIFHMIHSINLACVVCLPFVMLMTGEIYLLLTRGLAIHGGLYNILFIAFGLALLRMFDQISGLYQIKYTSSLFHIATRGLAWIPLTLMVTFSFKMELLISSVLAFGLTAVIFICVLVEQLTQKC